MEKLRIVIDIDDTICYTRDRDYKNSVPSINVISKVNFLHDVLGYDVTLYTSRGMVSCCGDIEKIIDRNMETLVEWLSKHNVKYDNIIFGKPLADIYVDDKCLCVDDFLSEGFETLSNGGSGKVVSRIGKFVKKDLGTKESLEKYLAWIDENNGVCLYPRFISKLYNSIYIEYIDGEDLSTCVSKEDLFKIILKICEFSAMTHSGFEIKNHINILLKNKGYDSRIDEKIEKCVLMLCSIENVLKVNASYCHGDSILSNIIKDKSGKLYFIDPQYDRESSSYLLDFAKLRMSLCGYEKLFIKKNTHNLNYGEMLRIYDSYVRKFTGMLEIVKVLEYMYILRLTRYREKNQYNTILEMIGKLESEMEVFKHEE